VGLADEYSRRLAALEGRGRSAAIQQVLIGLTHDVPDRYDPEAFNGVVGALRTGALQPA